jgi:two-component system response regulator RegA
LKLIPKLKSICTKTDIVVLTGYASIATAVEAIKLGARHYLAKPVLADEIIKAFQRDNGNHNVPIRNDPLSPNRIEWEHIQKVLMENDGNISETACKLRMHRRTLQRNCETPVQLLTISACLYFLPLTAYYPLKSDLFSFINGNLFLGKISACYCQ